MTTITHPVKHEDRTTDERYAVAPEHNGHFAVQYVARFCDEYIGGFQKRSAAELACLIHDGYRLGYIPESAERKEVGHGN